MSEFRERLDAEARRVRAGHDALAGVLRRAERRRRNRRIASGALALAIAGAGLGIAYAAFRPGSEARPAGVDGPMPGPTPTSDDATPPPVPVAILDGAHAPGLSRYAAILVGDLGFGVHHGGYRVEDNTITTEARYETTILFCPPQFDSEARRLRRLFFPGSEIRFRLPDNEIAVRIVLGEDFATRHAENVAALDLVDAFMQSRVEGRGAEAFLSPSASQAYEKGDLSLYGYARGGSYSLGGGGGPVTEAYLRDRSTFLVSISSGPGKDVYYETLRVGRGLNGNLQVMEASLSAIASSG